MKKNNKGFSLIDVVCATAIIALVALPICSGFLTAAKSNQRIQTRTETYNMLNNELSLILASGKVELDASNTLNLSEMELGDPIRCDKVLDSETVLKIVFTPKGAIANPEMVAYVEVSISYDDPETAETDDYKVSGVWTE